MNSQKVSDLESFKKMATDAGIKYEDAQFKLSEKEIVISMKGLIARDLWEMSEYYRIVNTDDVVINNALEIISDKNRYNKILGY
jgi:carboxyl-terminal processing protease